jgi:hypothetical protein
VPRCYLLSLCSGSSLDQHSNNVTLFNLVEQLNLRPNAPPPLGTLIPVEVHAYFFCGPTEVGSRFEMRFALVSAETGLESVSDVFTHHPVTPRYRTRTLGLPLPPTVGRYSLRLDWRAESHETWIRDSAEWPLVIAEQETSRPRVTH